jgi:hypothetical protein
MLTVDMMLRFENIFELKMEKIRFHPIMVVNCSCAAIITTE